MNDIELIERAKKALQNSYSPYSKFKVGAAALTQSGNVYTGCNIENSSYGASICAERVAISKAVSNGENNIVKIAIVSSSGLKTPPCGICRQFMSEFMDSKAIVITEQYGDIFTETIAEILPNAFKL